MLDISLIRHHPKIVKESLAKRNHDYSLMIDELISCDTKKREIETTLQSLRSKRNKISREIGILKQNGKPTDHLEQEVKDFSQEMLSLEEKVSLYIQQQKNLLLQIPNIPHPNITEGKNEKNNIEIKSWGENRKIISENHLVIGEKLGLFDCDRAIKLSGSGYTLLTGSGAKLERALINFLLDIQTQDHGYTEISPPFLVRRECMIGTGQLPKFEKEMYGIDEGMFFLIPTAEVSLTNIHRDEILFEDDLPIKYVACTPCFRREAGSTGHETRGMIRVHQFNKVELVKICTPQQSQDELSSLMNDAQKVLQLLELPYRIVEICTGDLGFSTMQTYDLEVWSPGQSAYLEVSSCSNFGDYQSRRMNLRYQNAQKKNNFCYTLNGSGTAIPRLYVALLENHLQPDGSVAIPRSLQNYYGHSRIDKK